MKIDKSAEEIIDKNDIDKGPPHWVTKKSAIISCNEFADQEVTKFVNNKINEAIDRIIAMDLTIIPDGKARYEIIAMLVSLKIS